MIDLVDDAREVSLLAKALAKRLQETGGFNPVLARLLRATVGALAEWLRVLGEPGEAL